MSNDQVIQRTYLRIGENKGAKRIWLQGLRLDASGLKPCARYGITYHREENKIVIDASNNNGSRVVASKRNGTREYPVIDINNRYVDDITQGADAVRVDYLYGMIVITLHHHYLSMLDRESRLLRNIASNTVVTGSLCAGIGVACLAMHRGLVESGLDPRTAWVVDREPKYLQVAVDNNTAVKTATIVQGGLEEVEYSLLERVDIMQVSLPCTGHSKSGKTKHRAMTNSTSFIAEQHPTDSTAVVGLLRAIETISPSVIISENVLEARESASYQLLRGMLQRLHYDVFETVLDETQAGSVEKRKRYWFVAVSERIAKRGLPEVPEYSRRFEKVNDIIDHEADHTASWSDNAYLKKKAIRDKAKGNGFSRNLLKGDESSVNCIGAGYMKRRSTEPMLTRADGKERLFSPVEHARLKGIPEDLVWGVSATTAHEGLGQSILFNHAKGLGWSIGIMLTGLLDSTGDESDGLRLTENADLQLSMGF